MRRRGTYLGGSTVVGPGSGFFSTERNVIISVVPKPTRLELRLEKARAKAKAERELVLEKQKAKAKKKARKARERRAARAADELKSVPLDVTGHKLKAEMRDAERLSGPSTRAAELAKAADEIAKRVAERKRALRTKSGKVSVEKP
jgi:hypothetical protein